MNRQTNLKGANLNGSDEPGLDFDFLRYIGVKPESMRQIQSHYLPYFETSRSVVDLACGDGDFVLMLNELGIAAVGVDSDDKASQAAQKNQVPLIHQDVFAYLNEQPENSVDGIFSAHLVEHLPYPKVLELVRQSFRILRPGGRIVLATPNVRTLFSHLEMFYLHFGHVSFYHPRLLCFFLQHEGFAEVVDGVNPLTASPMIPEVQNILNSAQPIQSLMPVIPPTSPSNAPSNRLHYQTVPPQLGNSAIRRLSFYAKRWLSQMIVRPLTDSLAQQVETLVHEQITQRFSGIEQRLSTQQQQLLAIANSLQSLNGPFECYATARKPSSDHA